MTGTLAASAVPAASRAAAPAQTSEAIGLADSRRRMLQSLRDVRRARGAVPRAQAFRRFARAARLHDVAELSFAANERGTMPSSQTAPAALYRQREPESVLVEVIVRELEAWPPSDGAWMTRFADLEAAIHARAVRA